MTTYAISAELDENMQISDSQSEIIPCYVYTKNRNNYQPAPIEDDVIKQRVIDFMDGKLNTPV